MDKQILLVNRHWHDINPVDCGWEACAPGHSFGPAARFYWLLHYVIQGRGAFTAGGKESGLGRCSSFGPLKSAIMRPIVGNPGSIFGLVLPAAFLCRSAFCRRQW